MTPLVHPGPVGKALLALLVITMLLVLVAGSTNIYAAPATWTSMQQATRNARIYVLRGGNAASDSAVVQALQERGFTVTSGVETPAFDGTQASLQQFDVVVILFNQNGAGSMPVAGQDALRAYIQGGGGVVTGEWYVWRGQLTDLMPAVNCGWNFAPTTTYSQRFPNPVINAGMPASFTFSLSNFDGTEACLSPRQGATLLYNSSNGGGSPGAPGLISWNVGAGRVASFSNLLGASELQNPDFRRLFQNTVNWVALVRDVTPPVITGFSVSGAGTLNSSRNVTLTATVTDAGGAGMGSLYIVEYVFSGNPAGPWRTVQSSNGWLPYLTANNSLAWTLTDEPGLHYLQVWAADRAGNISSEPVQDFISYQPAQASVSQGQVRLYRIRTTAAQSLSVQMQAATGNPDLYVFGPTGALVGAPESDNPTETVGFTAGAGVYQIEVDGFQAGAYTLQISGLPGLSAAPADAALTGRPRGTAFVEVGGAPDPTSVTLPLPPSDQAAFAGDNRLSYLPLVRRQ